MTPGAPGADYHRKFFCGDDILRSSDIPRQSNALCRCEPGVAHSFVGDLTNDKVHGVTFYNAYSHGKGGPLVSGENKDGDRVSVILHLRKVETKRALSTTIWSRALCTRSSSLRKPSEPEGAKR
jgi:hypothetical protein